ncbi:hypothetical protein [Litoribacillus peritrichatus]|uniref:Uncharacterized protein n=1 Tax=Litoribacillus peritrichatus TaxID=718191 RepID=A0ABP7MSC1_9GAMM
MEMFSHPKYFVSAGDQELMFNSFSEALETIDNALSQQKGKLSLSADDGLRPWWQRFVFGASNYIRMYLALEWDSNFSGLIFYDENSSEYRALSNGPNSEVAESIRNQISFGEPEPLEAKYCLASEVAFKAIREFMDSGAKPEWLNYEFVQ